MSKISCFILIAHGSKEKKWNSHLKKLLVKLRQEAGQNTIMLAYLSPQKPNLLDIVKKLNNDSVLFVLPLFIGPGKHISCDIPNEIKVIKKKYKKVKIKLLPTIGENEGFISLLANIIKRDETNCSKKII